MGEGAAAEEGGADNQLPLIWLPWLVPGAVTYISRLSPSLRNRIKAKSNTAPWLSKNERGECKVIVFHDVIHGREENLSCQTPLSLSLKKHRNSFRREDYNRIDGRKLNCPVENSRGIIESHDFSAFR